MIPDAVEVERPRPAAGLARNPSIKLFAALAAINFLRIGYQLVVVAWSAVQSTGRADAAGKILLISTVASLLLSPILGALVDYFARKKTMLLFGHLGIVVSGGIPLLTHAVLTEETMFEAIAVAVVLATVSSSVLGGAMDYFLKTHLQQSERPRTWRPSIPPLKSRSFSGRHWVALSSLEATMFTPSSSFLSAAHFWSESAGVCCLL